MDGIPFTFGGTFWLKVGFSTSFTTGVESEDMHFGNSSQFLIPWPARTTHPKGTWIVESVEQRLPLPVGSLVWRVEA